MPRANLFTIPPGAGFLTTFVDALLDGRIVANFPNADPLALAGATIYAPTRRAARALAQVIVVKSGGVGLLPRIVPLGRTEEIESALSFEAEFDDGGLATGIEITPAMDEIERRLVFANLIQAWGRAIRNAVAPVDGSGLRVDRDEALLVAATPAQALSLAGDLSALVDEFIIEGASWGALDHAVPEAYDRYWGITLDFLKIAHERWPDILRTRGCIDAAARRAALIECEARRILAGDASGPTIAIGSTGTNKSTARLLAAIARAPNGAVVLPGLDLSLDAQIWSLLANPVEDPSVGGHPQAALRKLMGLFGADRGEAQEIGAAPRAVELRMRFLSEALLPAEATDRWTGFDRSIPSEALAEVALIEAADEREEALALAVRLREALEHPNATAALVTPSRAIAARVRAELARWKLEIEDSAGEPLSSTRAGVFSRLALAAAEESDFGPGSLALLAHPGTLLGFDRARLSDLAEIADVALARDASPRFKDLKGCAQAARRAAADKRAHPSLQGIDEKDWADLEILLDRLSEALHPLRLITKGARLAEWIAAHRQALRTLGFVSAQREDERMLDALLDRLADGAAGDPMIFDAQDYLDAFENLSLEVAVRDSAEKNNRLSILGLLEARLMSFDVVLLAGLDETVWPPAVETGPFLNRPMRAELGLSPPERRIGQTAHDFVQAMGAPSVTLSRARKRGGAPTTPSRFLQRMEAIAGEETWAAARARGDHWRRLAESLDSAPSVAPLEAPKPRPALELRPRALSVTRIETLRRDPYAIYAEFILRIKPLAPIGPADAARAAGEELHDALAQFALAYPQGPLPADAAEKLRALAAERLGDQLEHIDWRVFYWPRLVKALDAFVAWENVRRSEIERTFIEQRGGVDIKLADGSSFRLTAIADRLDLLKVGSFAVIDYKSGRTPTTREIACGFSPQLTLEAAMIARQGFACAPAPAKASTGFYLSLSGGAAKTSAAVKDKNAPHAFGALAEEHFHGALALLSQFREISTPYLSRPYPQFASRFSDYDHLARVKEWSAVSAGEEST